MLMDPISKFRNSGRELVSVREQAEFDREAMRNWSQMLRKEAVSLREQAAHMNTVAGQAEQLAERIEKLLQSS